MRRGGGATLATANDEHGRTGQRHAFRTRWTAKRGTDASARQAGKEIRTSLDGLGSGVEPSRRIIEQNEHFAECLSNDGSLISPSDSLQDSTSEPPAAIKANRGDKAHNLPQARDGLRNAPRIEPSAGDGGGGFGAVRRRAKSGLELAAALETSRASERR